MNKTSIPWCDLTWNPITGCTRGCSYCYAKAIARRFAPKYGPNHDQTLELLVGDGGARYAEAHAGQSFPFGFAPTIYPHRLDEPLRHKKPSVIFLGSMGDLFDSAFPDEFRDRIFATVAAAPQHTFMVLTKQPGQMRDYFTGFIAEFGVLQRVMATMHGDMPANLWLGVTVTNQADADERIPLLLDTPAAHRFVSVEPMLGPVDVSDMMLTPGLWNSAGRHGDPPIDLVIVGAKTPGKPLHEELLWEWCPRPADECPVAVEGRTRGIECGPCFNMQTQTTGIDALRSLRDQCLAAGVPLHYKHGGTNPALDGVVYDWKPGRD